MVNELSRFLKLAWTPNWVPCEIMIVFIYTHRQSIYISFFSWFTFNYGLWSMNSPVLWTAWMFWTFNRVYEFMRLCFPCKIMVICIKVQYICIFWLFYWKSKLNQAIKPGPPPQNMCIKSVWTPRACPRPVLSPSYARRGVVQIDIFTKRGGVLNT